MMFALCLKIPTIFLEMIICWTTDLPTFSVLPFLLISYQSVVTSWRGILTDVKYIEKWQSIPVALVFFINNYFYWGSCSPVKTNGVRAHYLKHSYFSRCEIYREVTVYSSCTCVLYQSLLKQCCILFLS